MHKFTPGPWEVVDADDETPSHHIIPVNSNGYGHVGDRYMRVGGCIDIHDAQLIAAAPDLLSALQALVNAADNLDPQSGVPAGYQQLLDAAIVADAAIAKATGGAA